VNMRLWEGRFTSKTISLIFSILILSVHSLSHGAEIEEWCEKEWIKESGKILSVSSSNLDALLKHWKSYEPRCGKTQVYLGRLALIYVFQQKFSDARKTLAKVNAHDLSYGYAVDAARIMIDVQERLASQKSIEEVEIAEFENRYKSLVKKYPNWPSGYALLGGVQTLLGKHTEAVKNLDRAKQGDAYELWGVFRNLSISLTALRKFDQALEAADKAFMLNKSLTGDPQFAYALATSNAALGYFEDAEVVLNVILTKRPEVRNDPEFIHAVGFYREKLAQSAKKQ
jgi:tetratricopeptide (TPR) repeat protein